MTCIKKTAVIKMFVILFGFPLIPVFTISQDSLAPHLNKMFSAIELKQDLHFIKQKAEFKKYNETGLLFIGKKRFNFLIDSIEKVIDERKEMSRLEFYLLTAPLISELEDDDSFYSLKGEYAFSGKKSKKFTEKIVFPFNCTVINDSVYIIASRELPIDSRLLTINGKPAGEIAKEIRFRKNSRTKRYYSDNKIMGLGFSSLWVDTYTFYNFHDSVTVEYIPFGEKNNRVKTVALGNPGDEYFTDLIEPMRTRQYFMNLYFHDSTAVLSIEKMYRTKIDIDTLNAIFSRIKKSGCKNLLIDVMQCNRSYRALWLALLNYFYDGNIELYQYHKKPVDLLKYSKKRLKKSRIVKGKIPGNIDEFRFNGNVFLAFGNSTRNFAVEFVDIMQHNGLVKNTYGRETGSRATQYSYYQRYFLPITGLRLDLSIMLIRSLDNKKHERGILPAFEIPHFNMKIEEENYFRHNRLYMEYVIDYINKQKIQL